VAVGRRDGGEVPAALGQDGPEEVMGVQRLDPLGREHHHAAHPRYDADVQAEYLAP
jgi:hypothetical protein